MSLTARLSAFFLAALALVLAGFSVTLYVLASNYLSHQVDSRLTSAVDTVCTAAEVHADGIEWEGEDHRPPVGQGDGADAVRWTVQDGQGEVVAPCGRSPNLGHAERLPVPDTAQGAGPWEVSWKGQPWRLLQRRLQPAPGRDTGQNGPQGERPRRRHYAVLVVTAAVSLQALDETLRNLALALAGLAAVVWLGAALLGRWFCGRALRPISRMAVMARSMSADDLEKRLPCPPTRDEVEDLGRAFNDLLGRVHEAFERQRRFTGDASHQLRTPLTVLLGQLEVALRRDRPADAYREVLTRAHEQAGRLRQIVEMLLFLARADAEARRPNLEVVDSARWLPEYLTHWAQNPRAADLRLECPADGSLSVRVHAPLLGQLLDNLLDNACKYSAAGTPIHIRGAGGQGGVTLSVEDAGAGIAAEDLAHVFEPFYQATQTRGRGKSGVGLGLAIVERIAAALGGTVCVRSRPGEGSQFTVHLPAADAAKTAPPVSVLLSARGAEATP